MLGVFPLYLNRIHIGSAVAESIRQKAMRNTEFPRMAAPHEENRLIELLPRLLFSTLAIRHKMPVSLRWKPEAPCGAGSCFSTRFSPRIQS